MESQMGRESLSIKDIRDAQGSSCTYAEFPERRMARCHTPSRKTWHPYSTSQSRGRTPTVCALLTNVHHLPSQERQVPLREPGESQERCSHMFHTGRGSVQKGRAGCRLQRGVIEVPRTQSRSDGRGRFQSGRSCVASRHWSLHELRYTLGGNKRADR